MKTVKATEFKAKCLKIMDEVEKTGTPVLITKHGRPVAQLGPVETSRKSLPAKKSRKSLFGLHKGQIEILGDIMSPIEEVWEADR